jgi:hypothetical protein
VKYLLAAPAFALLAGMVAGCVTGFWPSDNPLNWQYHDHPLHLYVRTVNQTLDTTGIASCTLRLESYTYSRPSYPEGDVNYSFKFLLPETLEVEFAWPDTDWHLYQTTVHHLVGYQLEKGGDTTRLGQISGGDWTMSLNVGMMNGTGRLKDGRRMHTYSHSFGSFTDTIYGDSVIEVEMVCDLAKFGFVHATSYDTSLMLDQGVISRRRR